MCVLAKILKVFLSIGIHNHCRNVSEKCHCVYSIVVFEWWGKFSNMKNITENLFSSLLIILTLKYSCVDSELHKINNKILFKIKLKGNKI